MTYKMNDKINGFTITNIREIPQMKAYMHELTHDVTKAKLIYMQTADENKLFSVAFKTIPKDDTGVFHILEHSLLSGSEKYPLREPFVELLKTSMNTFLNALTFPDKTMYPVSSRNPKDFRNLMGVYLDAVFAPRAMQDPNIFYQEGWHYELREEEGTPIYKGVVFNEMKGAESNVDSLNRYYIKRMLYGETCYGFNSGGKVDRIPTLTYEAYCEMYRKYYHPTNAVFYLEGNLDLESALEDIQGYLGRYDGPGESFTIPFVEPKEAATTVACYDCGEEEADPNRCYINYAKLFGTYEDKNRIAAVELLNDYLTGTNEAPLTKAVLSDGLAEDFSIGLNNSLKQPYFQISVTNCSYENREAIHKVIFDTVKELAEKGLNRHDLNASLNEMEFQYREESEPKALYRNMRVLESAIYGGDPILYMDFDDTFDFLRRELETDYYEKLLLEMFDLEHVQVVYMLPSATIGEEKREAERKQLEEIAATWTAEDRRKILEQNKKLLKWQQTPDTPEVLATIPRLELTDVNPDPLLHEMEEKEYRGVTVLHHGEGTPGIAYLNLYFPIETRDLEVMKYMTLLPTLMGCLSTAKHSALEFQTDCQEHLGDMSYEIVTDAAAGETESLKLNFQLSIAVLNAQIPEALRLAAEVLKTTRFDEYDLMLQRIQQEVEGCRRSIISGGQNFALGYLAAEDVAMSAMDETLSGLTYYWNMKELAEHFEEKKEELCAILKNAQNCIFRKPSIISITSNDNWEELLDLDAWIDAFADESSDVNGEKLLGTGAPADCRRKDIPDRSVILIPSGVSYATYRGNMTDHGAAYSPEWRILSNILRFGYLWDEIRVQGGAYGTGASFGALNGAGFYSYRDPDPIRSLGIYAGADEFIRSYVEEAENLDSPIISTLASMEPLLSAADIGEHYDSLYIRGTTYEKRKDFRRKLYKLKKEDLLRCADALTSMKGKHKECVVGHAAIAKELEQKGFEVKSI